MKTKMEKSQRAAKLPTVEGVLFCERPDQTWPGRAKEINGLFTTMIAMLEEAKPLMKGDDVLKELVKGMHFCTLQAAAYFNVADQKKLLSALQKNQRGNFFRSFLKAA